MNNAGILKKDIDAISRIPIINTILEVICSTTGMGFAVIARVTDDAWIACAVRDEINFGLGPGGELKLETTLCHEVHNNNCEIVIDNVAEDMVYRNHHTPAMYGLQSYISVPINLKNGGFFGTLCAIDPNPHELNNPKVLGMFRLYADLISFHLAADEQISLAETNLAEERSAAEELKHLSKTLVGLNNQLIGSNKELKTVNNKLHKTQEELQESNAKLKESEEKLRQAIETGNMGTWSIDLTTEQVTISDFIRNLFGFADDEHVTNELITAQIDPNYVHIPLRALQQAQSGIKQTETIYPLTNKQTGERKWVSATGKLYRDKNNNFTEYAGLLLDITDHINAAQAQKQLNEELKSANDDLTAVTNNLTQAINLALIDLWSVDLQTGAVTLTKRAKELHGLAVDDELLYGNSLEYLAPEHQQVVDNAIQNAISNLGSFTVEYKIVPKDGSKERWIKSTGQVYADASGKAVKMQGLMADITKQKEDDQRKNDFIGMVSHEMKTPLTSLKGYIQLLQGKTKNYEDPFVGTALDKANNQIGKMTTMINGFLNVSRFESGKIHIEHERFDMKGLVQEIKEETVQINVSHNIVFDAVESINVNGDRDKIGQVITNFISNAFKYSALGTLVQVACVVKDGGVQVSVKDQGMGIAAKELDKLFDRYYRVEGQQMKSISGFGIGLYLSAEIIERHNGKIWVESELGKGSTFYFTLPLAK